MLLKIKKMTKIKNTTAYPIKQYPIVTDFFIGSDSENEGETVNFEIQTIVNMASGLMDYIYSKSSLSLTSPNGNGYFLTNGIVDFSLITTMSVSKTTLAGQNLTPYLNFLKDNTAEFTLKIISKTNQNIFAYYSIDIITEFTDYFVFDVVLAPGNNFLGNLIEKDIYTFVYEKIPGAGPDLITQTVTDGDTTHAPSGNAVFDFVAANSTPDATNSVKGKLKLAGDLGGTADLPTTPTAIHTTGNEVKVGSLTVTSIIKSGGLSSQFLKADGSIDTNAYAFDSSVIHTTGNETKSGNLTVNSIIRSGGLASQYLMADGSVSTASNISIAATQVSAIPHIDYLTGVNVQLQLDQTETSVISLAKVDKTNFKDIYQTGRVRIDTDTSIVSISSADTLTITSVDNILFINEIAIDITANKLVNFLLSFGTRTFVANNANTTIPVNTRSIFYVGIDKLGNSVYRTSKVYDQDTCYLARIIIANTAGVYSIVSFKYFPDLANNRVNNRDRLVLSSGYIVPSGAASISFGNRGVTFGKNSINYSNNKLDPNFLSIVDTVNPTPMQFLFALPNLSSLAVNIALSTILNPSQWYNSSGAIGAGSVANTNYQVYKLLVSVTGTMIIQTIASTSNAPAFGVNAIFANRDDALAGLTSVIFPDILPLGDSIGLGTFLLRAGTNVNGSQLIDPNDFYFRPYTATSSSSSIGVTDHDLLSNKNGNPTFQHVTTVDIANWNAKAPLASPAFTGVPTAPTAAAATNNTQIATTAFVQGSFVNLTTNQSIAGQKTFSDVATFTSAVGTTFVESIGFNNVNNLTSNGYTNPTVGTFGGNLAISGNNGGRAALSTTLIGVTARTFQFPDASGVLALTSQLPTNPVTGTGANGQVSFWNGTNSQAGDAGFIWDNTNKKLIFGTADSRIVGGTASGRVILSNLTTTTYVELDGDSFTTAGKASLNSTNGIIALSTAGVDRVTVLNGGNVGIGTPSPLVRTHIKSTDTVGVINVLKIQNPNVNNASGASIVLGGSDVENNGNVRIIGTNFVGNDYRSQLQLQTTTTAGVWNTGIYLNESGNVGIGTTVPGLVLSTHGTLAPPATTGTGSNGSLRVSSESTNLTLDMGVMSSPTYSWIQTRNKTDYSINYSLALNPNGGNVGIGTATPNTLLTLKSTLTNGVASNIKSLQIEDASGGNNANTGFWIKQTQDASTNGYFTLGVTDSGAHLYSLAFDTNGAERMRIDRSGNIGIGTTSPSTLFQVNGTVSVGKSGATGGVLYVLGASGQGGYINVTGDAGGGVNASQGTVFLNNGVEGKTWQIAHGAFGSLQAGFAIRNVTDGIIPFYVDNSGRIGIGTITQSEKLHVIGNILASGSITASSDIRLKTNIKPIKNSLLRVLKTQGTIHDRIDTGDKNQIGFIAQDLEKVFPELVKTEDTEEALKSVNYGAMTAVLVEAIKSQQKLIKKLEKRILILESK
jgi:hypothetical protein